MLVGNPTLGPKTALDRAIPQCQNLSGEIPLNRLKPCEPALTPDVKTPLTLS